ncbi:hypothetical protein KKH39_01115 [Patescibacteria group bacterium]|nr:hypothetical protein [Patescibacteria group bacterium]
MLDNKKVFFDHQDKGKNFFRTESGQEISIDAALFFKDLKQGQEYFLSFSENNLADQESKKILNDLLNEDE